MNDRQKDENIKKISNDIEQIIKSADGVIGSMNKGIGVFCAEKLHEKYYVHPELYQVVYAEGEIFDCHSGEKGLKISWGVNGVGFGELTFYYNTETKEWEADTEYMSPEFCKAVLNNWFEGIIGGLNG